MNLQSKKQAAALLLGLLLVACASIDSQDTEQYIFLDEWDLLFIEFKDSTHRLYEPDMPEISHTHVENRRRDFLQVIQELLSDYQLPIETYILDEGEEPRFGPVLEVSVMRFEQDSSGDLVATIRARLRKRGELNTLGTYTQRDTPPVGGGSQRIDEAYLDVIRKSLRKMMDDLYQHFPTPEEKKILDPSLIEGN